MSFDVDILFKIAAIGIAIALLNQILNKAGREEDDNACGSYHRSCDCN